jgi:predicted DNA-binding transcriptional regulator AlpA
MPPDHTPAAPRPEVAEAADHPKLRRGAAVWRYLGVGRTTFFELKSRAGFPRPVSVGGAAFYRVADLDAWVARLKPARLKRRPVTND